MVLQLRVLNGKCQGFVFDLGQAGDLFVGQRETAHIRLDDAWISWDHARIFRKNNEIWIEDLGSTNGTFVNLQRIRAERLKNEDVVFFGKTHALFVQDEVARSDFRHDLDMAAQSDKVWSADRPNQGGFRLQPGGDFGIEEESFLAQSDPFSAGRSGSDPFGDDSFSAESFGNDAFGADAFASDGFGEIPQGRAPVGGGGGFGGFQNDGLDSLFGDSQSSEPVGLKRPGFALPPDPLGKIGPPPAAAFGAGAFGAGAGLGAAGLGNLGPNLAPPPQAGGPPRGPITPGVMPANTPIDDIERLLSTSSIDDLAEFDDLGSLGGAGMIPSPNGPRGDPRAMDRGVFGTVTKSNSIFNSGAGAPSPAGNTMFASSMTPPNLFNTSSGQGGGANIFGSGVGRSGGIFGGPSGPSRLDDAAFNLGPPPSLGGGMLPAPPGSFAGPIIPPPGAPGGRGVGPGSAPLGGSPPPLNLPSGALGTGGFASLNSPIPPPLPLQRGSVLDAPTGLGAAGMGPAGNAAKNTGNNSANNAAKNAANNAFGAAGGSDISPVPRVDLSTDQLDRAELMRRMSLLESNTRRLSAAFQAAAQGGRSDLMQAAQALRDQELGRLSTDLAETRAELARTREELARARIELDKRSAELDKRSAELDEVTDEMIEKEDRIQELEDEVSRLRQGDDVIAM